MKIIAATSLMISVMVLTGSARTRQAKNHDSQIEAEVMKVLDDYMSGGTII